MPRLFTLATKGITFAAAVALFGCSSSRSDEGELGQVAQAQSAAKIVVCHIPPDDPTARHTITVPEAALSAHREHGDAVGECPSGCSDDTACDDGDLCTSDACMLDGTCSHVAVSCDDGNACTQDACSPSAGCAYVLVADGTCVSATKTLAVSISGSGTVTDDLGQITCTSGTCFSTYNQGTQVILTPTQSAGNDFQGWGGDCAAFGTSTCTLTMDLDRAVSATFVPQPMTCDCPLVGTGFINAATCSDQGTCNYICDCGSGAQACVVHDTGFLDEHWYDCVARDTWSPTEATRGCQAHGAGACTGVVCAGGGDSFLVCDNLGGAACNCWQATGTAAGHVSSGASGCACATTNDPQWH